MATLNIKDMRTASKKRITFADLSVGEVFEEDIDDNFLYIKIDDGQCLSISYENVWDIVFFHDDDEVFPLKATLNIEGRDE